MSESKRPQIVDAEALLREAEKANEALTSQDPFEGDCVSVAVTKQINLAQFQEEIAEQIGREVQVALVGLGLGEIASKDRPGLLYVSPKSVGTRALTEAVERHIADDDLLPSPQADGGSSGPSVSLDDLSKEAQAALAKANDGKTLTTAELTHVVTSLASALG
jgi:hypothetical protein